MTDGLISLLSLQLARLIGLVRTIEVSPLPAARAGWVLVVHGCGFIRVLRDEPFYAPNLIRPSVAPLGARVFTSQAIAIQFVRQTGLSSLCGER